MSRLPVAAALGAAAVLPLLGVPPYWLFILSTAFLAAAVATAWTLLALGGVVSFGHAAFFGVGAYLVGLAAPASVPLIPAIVLGALAAALLGFIVGVISARLEGSLLALATLAVAEMVRGVALAWPALTGGGAGLLGIPPLAWPGQAPQGRAGGYHAALITLFASLAILYGVRHARAGFALAALRESLARAQLLGVRPLPWRLFAFTLSAGITGAAGGVYATTARSIDVEAVLGRFQSIAPVVTATVGGVHGVLGPAVAAIGLHLFSEVLLHPYLPVLHHAPYAIMLVAAILYRARRRVASA
jgi:branched-chain amino acid transport system permease protein